ncbi:MAG: 4-hydroxy-tetrahydrodipicolinate synthase [Clostridia bacterium]|nr:4-hydroxy-tetrahydrodipicolinate synthase [Clostridia bacterium]
MKKRIFEGSGVAIVTPFNENGVNFAELDRLIEFNIENSTDAIIVCGTTGESATMPDKEHVSVIEHTVKRVNGRIPVIGGTGSNDTAHGIELSKMAAATGVDALLCVTPYYNKATQKGLIKHYEMIANAVDVPIIPYSVPSRTGVNILPQTAYELSKIDNIVGIKEASGDIVQAMEIKNLCGEDFAIYSGNDDINVPLMSVGAVGAISVLANVAPKETHDMCKYCLDGNFKEAAKLQLKYLNLIKALFCEVNPIPVKAALKLMGFDTGLLRMPLTEIEDKNLSVLKAEMQKCGIIA